MDRAPQPGDRRPAEQRGRLERAPGDRYAAAPTGENGTAPGDTVTSPIRGILLAAAAGMIGTAASIALFAVASVTAGLMIVAAVTALFVATGLRAGGGATIEPRLRRILAVSTALESVVVAQIGIWLFARSEGGALGLLDYLGQTFGPLVPLQLAVAALVAWWSAR